MISYTLNSSDPSNFNLHTPKGSKAGALAKTCVSNSWIFFIIKPMFSRPAVWRRKLCCEISWTSSFSTFALFDFFSFFFSSFGSFFSVSSVLFQKLSSLFQILFLCLVWHFGLLAKQLFWHPWSLWVPLPTFSYLQLVRGHLQIQQSRQSSSARRRSQAAHLTEN